MVGSIAGQRTDRPLRLVLAAPGDDHRELAGLTAGGALSEIELVDNVTGQRSTGLNLALRQASRTVCRIDARSRLRPTYVEAVVSRLERQAEVGMVGGVQNPIPGGPTTVAAGIARALSNPFVTGAPRYRRGGTGPVDTVYLGAYRRDDVLALGGYDEDLPANEDFDLAQRMRRAGWVVWLEDGVVVDYEARDTVGALWAQYAAFGRAKALYWRTGRGRPNVRQAVALAAGLVATAEAPRLLRRRRDLFEAAAAAAVALVAVDVAGVDAPASLPEHAAAAGAAGIAQLAWLTGVALGLTRSPASAPGPPSPIPGSRRRR